MLHEHLEREFHVCSRTTVRDAAVLIVMGFVIDDRSEGFSRLKVDPLKLLPSLMQQISNIQEGK
ncbi:MAG: hypothetical protein WCI02_13230 [Planctomycetota bacterium]